VTKLPRPFSGERTVVSTNGAGKTEYPHTRNEGKFLPYTICKN